MGLFTLFQYNDVDDTNPYMRSMEFITGVYKISELIAAVVHKEVLTTVEYTAYDPETKNYI
jgi:hypothetical protein